MSAMTPEALRKATLEAIAEIVPDADVTTLDWAADLRDELDIDSMDVLRIAETLRKSTGIDIPEIDLGKLESVDAIVAYLEGASAKG